MCGNCASGSDECWVVLTVGLTLHVHTWCLHSFAIMVVVTCLFLMLAVNVCKPRTVPAVPWDGE
eukprot:3743583-Pyramimonas_sp.AAC.1